MSILLFDTFYGTTHDGPGMRTTFFLKGCPLRCAWCHNPEGIGTTPELWWNYRKCIGCLECVDVCPQHAILAEETGIRVDEKLCRRCFACAKNCPAEALARVGEDWEIDALVHEAKKGCTYYKTFGGGVTASGGEPMLQHEALTELFRRLAAEGISTALDTCGNVPWEWYEKILPYTSCVLYDIKLMDSARHLMATGADNERILTNLKLLIGYKRARRPDLTVWIRTPLIPGYTEDAENLTAIGTFLMHTCAAEIERWELCCFNNLCVDKYRKLWKDWTLAHSALIPQERADEAKAVILATGFPPDKLIVSGISATKTNPTD